MITSVDTNVVSAIWSAERSAPALVAKLGLARSSGAVLMSPVVFAELHAYPGADAAMVGNFISATSITIDYRLLDEVWMEAGRCFAVYSVRRRQSGGGSPRGLLPDFVIGAHALIQADCLLTLDVDFYQQYFPKLKLC